MRPAASSAVADTASDSAAAPGALVVGGALGALGVVRSLGRQGIPVAFLTHDHPIAGFSRYVGRRLSWAGPEQPNALDTFKRLIRNNGLTGWTVFACADAEVRFVAQNHAALSGLVRLTTPPWEITRWCHDKRLTYRRAAELGIDVPWSAYPRDRGEVTRLDCRFPVILKPTVRDSQNAFTMAKAWRVDDRAELLARYDEAARLVGEATIILQEMIPGGGEQQFSFAAVCERGEAIASLVARRTRQYPIDFGYTSTFVESIEQPDVEAAARRMLRAIDFTGLVEVEFKLDARDGRYKILDINPRSWTWIGLGALAGVDYPLLAWRGAHGEAITPVRGRTGVAWMHASRDLVAAGQEIWRGRRTVASYLRSLRQPIAFAAFAKDDPLPGLVELPLVASRVLTVRLPARLHGLRKAAPARPQTTV